MLPALLAIALTVDAGLDAGVPDAGPPFQPVVLDVVRGTVWTREADGGESDAPTLVLGGTWMDDPTTIWVGQNKAKYRAEAQVPPEVDTKTLTTVGAVMFAIGAAAGAAAAAAVILAVPKK